MNVLKKYLLHLLAFESQELRSSYKQFQSENEKTLTTVITLMVLSVSLIVLIFEIIYQASFDKIAIQSLAIVATIMAFVLRKKYPKIQKAILISIMGSAVAVFMLDTQFFSDDSHILADRFLLGNGCGLVEMILILSFRSMAIRAIVFSMFIVIKLFVAWKQMMFTEYINFVALIAILLTLIFLLIDNMLDRKIFKMVYESRDKSKKFQSKEKIKD